MYCSHDGNAVVAKNVPDNRNCGKVMMLESGGTVLSFLAIPDMINPKPINTIRPIAESISILTTVISPWMSVNPKK